jgi:hypothetical protein
VHWWWLLCPKLLFACIFHFALTLRTGLHIPDADVIAATLQAQTAHLTSKRWGHVCNDTTHHKVLDGMAIIARYGSYLLSEQSASFVHLSLIATGLAAIFPFPGHLIKQFLPNPQDGDGTNNAEHKVGKIAFTQQFDV